MSDIDPRLIIAFLWIAACTAVTFWLLRSRPAPLPRVAAMLLVALSVRLIPALILPRGASYEMDLFLRTAQSFREGENVYLSQMAHPYLPFQLYWIAAADWLADQVGLFFIFWLKSINILADTVITGLVYLATQRLRDRDEALWNGWLYAFNPVTILVVAYQGQFDAIPMLLLIAAWYFLTFDGKNKPRLAISATLLGLAILSKTWPAVFLFIAFMRLPSWYSRIRYSLIAAAIPVIGILLYELIFPGSFSPIVRRAIRAGAISGWWGYSAIGNNIVTFTGQGKGLYDWLTNQGKWFSRIAGLLTVYLTRKRTALYSLTMTILVLYATVPNLGLQSLSWVVPLALILGMHNEFGYYIAGVTVHMIVSYWGIHLTGGLYLIMPSRWAAAIIQLSSLTAWLVIVVWCLQEALQSKLFPPIFPRERTAAST